MKKKKERKKEREREGGREERDGRNGGNKNGERERDATGPYPTTPPLFTACSAEEVRRRNLPLLGDTLPSSLSSSPSYFTRRLRDRPPPRSRSWRRPENPSPLRTRGREKGRRERV